MTPEFTREQSNALGDEYQMEMVDPVTGRTFVVIVKSFYAINHRDRNLSAILRGLDDMQAGRHFAWHEGLRLPDDRDMWPRLPARAER